MPFTNEPASSEENFFAISMASFRTTFGGVSPSRNSWMARRRIARSMAASRSNRQFSQCLPMISSSAPASFAVPSNSLLANARVLSAAFAPFQNLTSSLAKSCWLISHWKSICMTNSRDFVRRDTLLASRLTGGARLSGSGAQLSRQLGHFDGRQSRFKSLVPALEPGAIDGLFQRVAGQHAKYNWQAAIHLRELQSARRFRTHVIIMRCLATQNTPDSDQRIVFPRRGQFFRRKRQFECSRNMHNINILVARPRPLQRIHCRRKKPVGDKTVKSAH